ncbi:MAG: sterol desaturase family protein [Acidimicrobiia bacterium]
MPDPTLYAIPVFLAALAGEAWYLGNRARRERVHAVGYERRDTWASLGMGIGSLFFVGLINLAMLWVASFVWDHKLVDVGTGVFGWTVAIVGWDFVYYWHHRWEHEIRLLWAAHVNHHSSQRFNLSTALRQSWTTWPTIVLYPSLALVGVKPEMILVAAGINLIYQFWVHTEIVGRLPGWYELVLNTPSHHRVHHGSNARYLDRNYAGILMIWDRMFGTFEPERERVVYGLTKNIRTYNLLRIAFHEYVALWHDVRGARSWRDRIGHVVHGPAWQPSPVTASA